MSQNVHTPSGTKPQPRPVQLPSPMPFGRYSAFQPVSVPDRTWPNNPISQAPRWLSTDLRDGNQALVDPMTPLRKRKVFDLLVAMGYKEIEIGFPSASQTDFDFVRQLIETDAVPEDVTISVLTQAREDLIERTVQSLIGSHRATIHLYNATAELFRRVVFKINADECIALAARGTKLVCKYAEQFLGDVEFGYQYSPEIFTQTPTDFAVEVCNAVIEVWQPGPDREIILNLPATVEMSTPNTYADQIEYFARQINSRDQVAISLHPHNDRGTAVAAAELGLMAGADRVEGCLFGHGERTGNVDLVTLGMNLFSQGIDPKIDFSDIDHIRRTVEYATNIDVHPRHPYAGELVYTAFSGSHQDAIKKGLEELERVAEEQNIPLSEIAWQAPYLPIDPHDVGRSYEAVIRVNSQSGKGGMAYLMKNEFGYDLPRRLQVEFSRVVQDLADGGGGEVASTDLLDYFTQTYFEPAEPLGLIKFSSETHEDGVVEITATVLDHGQQKLISGEGNGPLSAFLDALSSLGYELSILDYREHAMSGSSDAQAVAYLETEVLSAPVPGIVWGVGLDANIVAATLQAAISAVNRAYSV